MGLVMLTKDPPQQAMAISYGRNIYLLFIYTADKMVSMEGLCSKKFAMAEARIPKHHTPMHVFSQRHTSKQSSNQRKEE